MSKARHVAIIMDGNGRWAKQRHLPRAVGHQRGVEAVRRLVRAARTMGLEALTLYAFSTENWRRPEDEIADLMGLLKRFILNDIDEFAANDVRLRVIGDYRAFPADVVALIDDALARTAQNRGTSLVVALNYGAQDEIARAARKAAEKGQISTEAIEAELDTAGLPPLDLLIRTSGEVRLSNFLLWQAAYAELCFVDVLWPDFTPEHLDDALAAFAGREGAMAAAELRANSDMAVRIASAAVMLALAGTAFWLGGIVLDGFIVIVALLTLAEFGLLVGRIRATSLARLAMLLGGAVYVGYSAFVLILLPSAYVAVLVGAVVATDTGAFFTGRTFRGPKIAPRISPSKTWSGGIGGMLAAALWMMLALGSLRYGLGGMDSIEPTVSEAYLSRETLTGGLVGAGLAVAAQAGDFLESWIKRRAGVKDSSSLIPGHGGVFDRTDGILPVAVLAGLALAWPL